MQRSPRIAVSNFTKSIVLRDGSTDWRSHIERIKEPVCSGTAYPCGHEPWSKGEGSGAAFGDSIASLIRQLKMDRQRLRHHFLVYFRGRVFAKKPCVFGAQKQKYGSKLVKYAHFTAFRMSAASWCVLGRHCIFTGSLLAGAPVFHRIINSPVGKR